MPNPFNSGLVGPCQHSQPEINTSKAASDQSGANIGFTMWWFEWHQPVSCRVWPHLQSGLLLWPWSRARSSNRSSARWVRQWTSSWGSSRLYKGQMVSTCFFGCNSSCAFSFVRVQQQNDLTSGSSAVRLYVLAASWWRYRERDSRWRRVYEVVSDILVDQGRKAHSMNTISGSSVA